MTGFKEYFDGEAPSYHKKWERGPAAWLRRWEISSLKSMLEYCHFDTLLDLGCGSGLFIQELQKDFTCQAELVDQSLEMVAQASRQGLSARQADACHFREEHIYDLVLGIGVLEFLSSKSGQVKFLDTMIYHSGPRGYLLLYLPDFFPWKYFYRRFYLKRQLKLNFPSIDDIVSYLSLSGFELLEKKSILPAGRGLLFRRST